MPAILPATYPNSIIVHNHSHNKLFKDDYVYCSEDYLLFFNTSSASYTKLHAKLKNKKAWEYKYNIDTDVPKTRQLLIGSSILELPKELSEIAFAIKDSQKILDLKEDWDSEGALAVPKFVWERATNILSMYSKWILENRGIILLTPSIDALADGSIDIMWNSPKARLLLNIRNNTTSSEAHFYGDTYGGKNKFKGVLEDLNEVQEFFAYWLTDFIKC